MAEETKGHGTKKAASAIFKIILGIIFLVLGVLAIVRWRFDLLMVIKGCIGPILVLAAIITFAIAKE